ncbi:DUF1344 domain-containing protein [Rhizobium paknamense]|uniref:DUF1344 domain-containing protein n=1 Tax=Rhizobium paknamense TaxID=1206817 RepID=A0ABU0IA13_9HYPH|nr:DUF1344 domain-containing protein [Rhizobium paknamense]MDQ0455072.1 hypothetical protein [Rhizobium paknamense]
MRFLIAMLMLSASFFQPMQAFAVSDDVEATIKTINQDKLVLTLDDGKNYSLPEEFNFDGLKPGQKVIVYYTVVDGKRVVDDLQIVE